MLLTAFLYSAVLRSRADSLRSHLTVLEWLAFYSAFLNIHRSGVHTALAWLVPHETAAILAQVLCTPYNHELCHFMQKLSHIRKVRACLAVTCQLHFTAMYTLQPCTCRLHFWQNDRIFLRADWEPAQEDDPGEEISPDSPAGTQPETFRSKVRRSNHWAIPAALSNSLSSLPFPYQLVSW